MNLYFVLMIKKPDIINAMKKMLQTDRIIIVIGGVCLLASLFLPVKKGLPYQILAFALFVILVIRYFMFFNNDQRKCIPDCPRSLEATRILLELANEMRVNLRQTKPLEVPAQFNGARCDGEKIELGSSLLYGLDDAALKGIFAHELGHIKNNHPLKIRLSYLLFLPAFISLPFAMMSKYAFVIVVLLILAGIIVWSLLSWIREFEADAEGAKSVGVDTMAHALEECSKFIYRPGGTLEHPSFKNRILRVSPKFILTDEDLRNSRKP